MSKKLFLHIGARKTGSSMLQTMFARNTDNFLKQSLYYPIGHELRARALRGVTTSGNGEVLMGVFRPDVAERHRLRNTGPNAFLSLMEHAPCDKVLISSEFYCAARAESLEQFNSLMSTARLGFEFIYVVRNPLDHAFSMWTQNIKDGRELRGWREFLHGYVMPFDKVIHRFKKHVGDCLHVLNYDRCKASLLQSVCDIVGVSPDVSGQDIVVNRSPTKSEAELLLHITKFLADAGAAQRDRTHLIAQIYRQIILTPVRDRMRPLVTGDDLSVLERNNTEQLAYVNEFVSNGPLSLYEGEVATGEIVLSPPPEDTRIAIDATLTAVLSLLRSREGAFHHGREKDRQR